MTGRSLLMDALTDVQNLHSYILLFLYPAKTGRLPNQDMAKIQNISEIHPALGFTGKSAGIVENLA